MIPVLLHVVLALSVVTFILLVLVTRFGLVEASLASLLSRALKGSSFDQSQRFAHKCRVERRSKGVRIHNVRLAEAALQKGSCGAFHLLRFAIAYIDIELPSWRRPLRIHVRGVEAELRQRQMPQHVDAEKQRLAEQQLEKELRAEKLATVDSILWRTNFFEQDRASQEITAAAGCFTNKALARLCHRALVLCTQCMEMTMDDLHLELSQHDESGPRAAVGSNLEGKDALRLSIRQLLLMPQGANGEAEPRNPGVRERDASGWWEMLCAPGAITRFLVYETPSAAKLEVAGFSLSLCNYDARQPSEHAQAEPPAAFSSHAAPAMPSNFSSSPFSEGLPTMPAAAHVTYAGGRPDPTQPFRRRKRLRAAGARTAATLSGACGSENLLGRMAPLDRDFPVEEYVLVQQWGFSIDVRVLPPLWREPESSEPLSQKNINHDTRPSMYTNPLYTSEETSTSSVSDTVEMMEDLRHTVSSIPEAAEVAEADALPGLTRRRMQGETGSRNAYAPPGRPPGTSSLNGLGMADGHKGFEKPCKVKPQPDASCTVEVDVLLRAFVPVLSAQSAAVAIRMLERLQQFEEYERFWRVRPQVSVTAKPQAWWQHAGHAVKQECHSISRRQASLRDLDTRRAHRLRYQELYTKASANLGTFHEPSRRWWQRRVAAANKAERAELAALESSLTLEEIAHFRAGVAAVHSRLLAVDHGVLQHAMDAVDAVVGTPGAVPQQVEDMLFQRCAQGQAAPGAPPVVVTMSVSCPKLGLQLAVGEEWMALTPRVPLSPFHTLEAAIRDVSFSVQPTGEATMVCESMAMGGLAALDEPLPALVMQSPSKHCMRLLAVADLHAAACRVQSSGAFGAGSFLTLRIGRTCPGSTAPWEADHAKEWSLAQPRGMQIEVEAAGIVVMHNTDAVVAALSFFGQLDRHRHMPLARPAPRVPAHASPVTPPDPTQPQTLSQRAKQAFTQHNLPIRRKLAIPLTSVRLSCPGIVGVIQYHHSVNGPGGPKKEAPSGAAAQPAPGSEYELVAAVSGIRAQVYGEDFQDFMHHGATQRSSVHAYMDLFCYQAPASRRRGDALQRRLLSFRTVAARSHFLRRESSEDLGSQEAADPDMQAMAQVWGHPEDLHLYPGPDHHEEQQRLRTQQDRRTSFMSSASGGGPHRTSSSGGPPPAEDTCPPFPLVPLLKVASMHAELSQKVVLVPTAPTSLNASLALGAIGIMVWVSPWQVAHVLSIVRTLQGDLAPAWQPAAAARSAARRRPSSRPSFLSSSHLHIACTLDVPLISAIVMVSKDSSNAVAGIDGGMRFRRWEWGRQIGEGQAAHAWSRFLTPLYGMQIIGLLASMTYSGTGRLRAGLTMDGVLVRDLQLRPNSKFAFLLRPLPARAAQLASYATSFRRRILRVIGTSKAKKRWNRATRMIVLRLRAKQRMFFGSSASVGAMKASVKANSFLSSGVLGPQLSLAFNLAPPQPHARGHGPRPLPEPADLQIEVGQMLTNLRVSTNNMLLPFTAQILQLLQDTGVPEAMVEGGSEERVSSPRKSSGMAFPGLKMQLGMVGLDLVLLVMGRELVSFKIVDAALTVDVASASEVENSANPSAVTIGLTVEDMSLRDMQARPEHSMVLRPNSAAESCSLTLEYTQPLKRSQPPSLIIEMANPRMLILFRFLHDILFGVQIITRGLKGSAGLLEEPGGAPAPSAHQPVQKPARQEEEEEQPLPLQLLIFVTNLSVLLPASSKSRQVLECDADTLIVGVPGLALPDSALATALLPSVPDMVDASLRCSRLAQKVARPAQATPEGQPDNAAGNDGGDGQKDGGGSADADAEEDEHLEVHNSDSVFTKAMKNFAQWEAREERRLHKDLQQHQRGVLFLGEPPPDPTPPDTSTGVLRVPDQATGSAGPSSLSRAARRTPFAEASGQVPAPAATSTLPAVPEAGAAGPSLGARLDKGKQAADSRLQHEDVLAGVVASGTQAPGRLSSAPAELPSRLQSHGPMHHLPNPSGVAEDEAPEVSVAILADGLVVRCASLGPTVAAPSRRRTEFCPNTVDVFAWPMDQYDLTTRAPFIHQANYALVMFEQHSGAHVYTQLHLTANTLAATLNNANYSALLGFAQGNLAEMSTFSRAQPPAAQPQERRTTFAETFCFEPPAGDRPSFYMTVSAPDLTVVLEAEPREWQSDCCMEGRAPSHLHPFLKTRFEDVAMDLATLQGSGATHISITAGTVRANDLRMAYSRALRHLEIVRDGASAFAASSAFQTGGGGASSGVHFNDSEGSAAAGGPSWERVASRLGASNAAAPLSMAAAAAAGPARLGMGDLLLERCTSISIVKKVPRSSQGLSAGQRAATLGPPGMGSPLRPPAGDQGSARSGSGPSKLPTDASHSQQGSSRRGKWAASAAPQPWYMPVVEVATVPELSMAFPQGAPVVHLIRSPVVLQEKEAVHLVPDEDTNMPEGVTLEVALGLLKDGTVAIQAALVQAQLQWPFLHDVSLISAITSVFLPPPAPGLRGDANAAAAAAGAVASALQAGAPQPWLYFNLLTVNSALFVPVLDKVATFETVRQKFGPAAAHTNLHDRLADVLLVATALSGESPDTAMRLEQRGLAASWSGLRFAFATGGDGESDMRVDLRNFAAFVRDPAALVTCLLLPHSCSVRLEMQVPRVAEAAQVSEDAPAASQAQDGKAAVGDAERNKARHAAERAQRSREERAAIAIQRAFRRWRRRKRRSSKAQDDWMQTTGAEVLQRLGRPPPLKVPSPTEESLIDELVMKVASPRTKDLLQDYSEQYRADDRARVVAVNHTPTSVRLGAKLGSLTLRAAFSHIPFLHSAQWMLQAVCLSPDASAGELATAAAAAGQEVGFRPSKLRVDAAMRAVSLVLCNDKLSTYGAPDVLQVSLDQLDAHFSCDRCFADRPSNQVGRVTMRLWASFLNNSSSRWEPIWENWPLQIDMVDNVSPIYRSDFTRRLWVGSEEHLNVQFNPAALLSLGDARAFLEALSDVEPRMPAVPRGGPTPSTVSTTSRLAQLDAAPQMAEQMAQRGSITSRVPQKYLIQNQSGLTVFYWVDPAEGVAQRTFSLECGASETLKVAPTRKVLNISTFSKGGCIEKVGNVINLYFEGNWMPIKDVAVSVVGKYRYFMHSPAEHDSVPVIVDIILVGRTKIITLHSSIWLDNRTDRRVAFRLHVPITPLVAPVAEAPGSSAAADFKTDAAIGPLSPGEGVYLPLTAVLGGLLFVQPEGYEEAKRDVIRLTADVDALVQQQGYITCDPLDPLEGGPMEPLPLHCSLLVIPAQVNSEFQAFKHIKITAPGEMARATKSLEATLALQPTLILTNSLPCSLDVVVWQVAPFRKLRKQKSMAGKGRVTDFVKYDIRQMHVAFTGTVPLSSDDEEELAHARMAGELGEPGTDGEAEAEADRDRSDGQGRGQYITVSLKPGVAQNVYANMEGNVLVHVSAPALGLSSMHWAVVSWGQSQLTRESLYDAKYIYRLPKEIVLQQGHSPRAARSPKASTVARFTAALKRAGRRFQADIAKGRATVSTLAATGAVGRRGKKAIDALKKAEGQQRKSGALGLADPDSAPTLLADQPPPSQHPTGVAEANAAGVRRPQPLQTHHQRNASGLIGPASPTSPFDQGDFPPERLPTLAEGEAVRGQLTSDDIEAAADEGTPLLGTDGHSTAFSSGRPELPPVREGDGAAPAASRKPPPPQLDAAHLPGSSSADASISPENLITLNSPQESFIVRSRSAESLSGPSRSDKGKEKVTEAFLDLQRGWLNKEGALASRDEKAAADLELLQRTFNAWRSLAAAQHVRRVSSAPGEVPPHERRNAPPQVFLGIDNSRARGRPEQPLAKLTFFASYWIDNRTGMDLVFQDHAAAAPNPLLLGARMPGAFAQVLVPALPSRELSSESKEVWDVQSADEILVSPVLLNSQETTRFCLAKGPRTRYSQTIHVNTVGSKGSVKIRDSAVVQPPAVVRGMLRVGDSLPRGISRASISRGPGGVARRSSMLRRTSAAAAGSDTSRPSPAKQLAAMELASRSGQQAIPLNMEGLTGVAEEPDSPPPIKLMMQVADGADADRPVKLFLDVEQPTPTLSPKDLPVTRAAMSGQMDTVGDLATLSGALKRASISAEPIASVPEARAAAASPRRAWLVHREYEFAVEVTAGPPNSVFRHTKVVTVKSRFIADNQTGMVIEIKQKGTPDLGDGPLDDRCARRLKPRERAAIHWDDAELPKEVVMRPASRGHEEWHWSGSFRLSTREEYFGLRVRSKVNKDRAINVPVNCTVGPSGTVLVTFKSHTMSVPPYRIENQCSDVHIYLVQACLAGERPGRWIWLPPRVAGSSLAYAWDEPNEEHRLRVKARVAGKTGTPVLAEYSLDRLGPKPVLRLPTAKRGSADHMANTNVPSDLQEKVASLLASESSRKVYITVFADGPTRVLRFADVQNVGAEEAQQSILDLAARLKQVEEELWQVNARFSALHGATGDRQLDLYGRAPSSAAGQQQANAAAAADETGSPAPTGGSTSPPVRLKMAGTGAAAPAGPSAAGALQLVPEGAPLVRDESIAQEQLLFQTPEAQRLLDTGPSTVAEAGSCASSESGKSVIEEIVPPSRTAILEASALESRVRRGGGGDLGHLLPMSASSRNVQGSQLMRSAAEGDSALLLGGDLIVTVFMAEQLQGQEKLTHPFARVRVEDQSQLTTVQWQSLDPVWEETLFFRDVCAASELVVEVWDVGGQKSSEQLQRITIDPVKLIANSRFQGRVEVPLSETLRLRRGSKHWYTLMRRDAADTVSGRLQLGFAWDVTARSLLSLKLAALENVLAQRQEILCALNPVPASVTQRWTREALKAPEDNTQGSLRKVKSAEKLLDDVLSWHSLDEQRSTLVVTVLEARGMQPRKGVVVAFQAHQLPNPLVEVMVPGHVAYQAAAKQTLKPHFQTAEPARFQRLAADAMLTVRLYDDKAGRKKQLLGEAQLSCSHLQGVDPMYVWLPLTAAKTSLPWHSRHSGAHFIESVAGVPDLQVHLRLQWVRQVERGRIMHLDLNMEGLGFSVVGGLQDELFNMTLDQLRIKAERTRAEAKLNGSIQRIQLDNQMLDATQPVVLAPASAAHAHAEAGKMGGPTPIMRFGVVRSFANSLVTSSVESGSAPASPVAGPSVLRKEGDILSFRSLYLDVGEIDVQTDDGFLEAFLTFIVALPLADIWQDVAWREQQRRLLTAQFGPREVESLAMNAVLPLDTEDGFTGTPLRWVQERELKELAVLRGQSAHSSWFFIESAHIGDINANVTIALTSSILAARHGATAPEPASGLFRRLIGASGFQLINVNNVPLSLRGWSVDTRLIGRKALTNSLMRHYIAQAISEAHKVLGGAGPAIAAVPLTVVWAGGSFVTLATGLGAGKVGPVGAVQRVGYVFFMSIAQVVGSFSRVGLSLFTYVPPNQTGTFSDTGALNRAVQRPANAFDAFRRAVEEGCSGLWSGVSGVVMDPTQGFHSGGMPVALLGVGKGLVGLAVRPTMGLLEMTSKGTYGMGLVCLGREAISGSTLRRVRAPGALAEDSSEAVENAKDPEVRARNQRLIESWQSALPTLFPAIKAGKVLDVMQAGEKRVVLVTDKDVALLRLKIVSLRSTYRPMWFVRLSSIQTVRGDSERLRIVIDYLHQVDTHCMGTWTVPGRKRIPCSSRDVLERLALKINYNIRTVSQGARPLPDTGFARFSARELSIFG